MGEHGADLLKALVEELPHEGDIPEAGIDCLALEEYLVGVAVGSP